MPELSRFLGVVISMYYNGHRPAHFHASYGEFGLIVYLEDGSLEGRFPRRATNLVLEWYHLHRDELSRNWARAVRHEPLLPIPPLE